MTSFINSYSNIATELKRLKDENEHLKSELYSVKAAAQLPF
jgi:cell shape-determining protein MreC